MDGIEFTHVNPTDNLWMNPPQSQPWFTLPDVLAVRDQLAMSALTGLLASMPIDQSREDGRRLMQVNGSAYARIAYELADAMMQERGKPTTGETK